MIVGALVVVGDQVGVAHEPTVEQAAFDLGAGAVGFVGDDQRTARAGSGHPSNHTWAWPVPDTDS